MEIFFISLVVISIISFICRIMNGIWLHTWLIKKPITVGKYYLLKDNRIYFCKHVSASYADFESTTEGTLRFLDQTYHLDIKSESTEENWINEKYKVEYLKKLENNKLNNIKDYIC